MTVDETGDAVSFFTNDVSDFLFGGSFLPIGEFAVEGPCAFLSIGEPGQPGETLQFIGRRNGGIQAGLTDIDFVGVGAGGPPFQFFGFEFVITDQLGQGESFCDLSSTTLAIEDRTSLSSNLAASGIGPTVIAFNSDDITVSGIISDRTQPGPAIRTLTDPVALDLDTTEDLEFVGSVRLHERGLGLVFTDGEHAGIHRLVVVGVNVQGEIAQATYSWPTGVPESVIRSDVDDDLNFELIVISSSSPQAIVFEEGADQGYLDAEGPSYLEIGLGASSAATAFNASDLLAAYPELGEVRQFSFD
ncbi:MAG: hypothetical protein AAGJ50_12330 [Pseudomonadota bacterium]